MHHVIKQQLTFQYDDSVDAFITTTSYIADSLNLVFCLFPPHWDVYSGCFLSLTQIWSLYTFLASQQRTSKKNPVFGYLIVRNLRLIMQQYSPLIDDRWWVVNIIRVYLISRGSLMMGSHQRSHFTRPMSDGPTKHLGSKTVNQ